MLDRDKETVPLLESDVLEDGRKDDAIIEMPEVELSHGKLMENDKFPTFESTNVSLLRRLEWKKLMRLIVLVAALVLIIGLTSSKVLEKRQADGASGAGEAGGASGAGACRKCDATTPVLFPTAKGYTLTSGAIKVDPVSGCNTWTLTCQGPFNAILHFNGNDSLVIFNGTSKIDTTLRCDSSGEWQVTASFPYKQIVAPTSAECIGSRNAFGTNILNAIGGALRDCGDSVLCRTRVRLIYFAGNLLGALRGALNGTLHIVAGRDPGITIPTTTTTTMATTTAMTTTTAPSSCTVPSRQIIYSDYKNASNVSYNYLTPCKNGSTTCIGMLRKQCYQETSDRACPNSLLCLNSTINVITVFNSPADKCPGAGDETLHVYPLGVTSKGDNAEAIDCSCYSVINAVAFNFYVNNAATPPQYKIAKNTATPQPAAPFVFTFAFCAQAFA